MNPPRREDRSRHDLPHNQREFDDPEEREEIRDAVKWVVNLKLRLKIYAQGLAYFIGATLGIFAARELIGRFIEAVKKVFAP